MKRLFLLVSILLSASALAVTPGKTVSRTSISAIIAECRGYDGVEVVNLGRLTTAALKGVARIATIDEKDSREALALLRGVRGLTVLDYEDCSASVKARITRKLNRALSGCEMLMEASDDGEKMRIYGLVDEKSGKLKDCVIYTPSDYALVCVFGSISMDTLSKMMAHD